MPKLSLNSRMQKYFSIYNNVPKETNTKNQIALTNYRYVPIKKSVKIYYKYEEKSDSYLSPDIKLIVERLKI